MTSPNPNPNLTLTPEGRELRGYLRKIDAEEVGIAALQPGVEPGRDGFANSDLVAEYEAERDDMIAALRDDGHAAAADRLADSDPADRPADTLLSALEAPGSESDNEQSNDGGDGGDGGDDDEQAALQVIASGDTTAALASSGPEEAPDAETVGGVGDNTVDGLIVHGRALGVDDVTAGTHGVKYWPAEEAKKAASSLEGAELAVQHEDRAIPCGTVTSAGWNPASGIEYEAEIDPKHRHIAEQLGNGTRDVSIEASVPDHSHIEYEEINGNDVPYMTDYSFNRLSVVSDGAASTHAAAGAGADDPAYAALSVDQPEVSAADVAADSATLGEFAAAMTR